MKFLSRWRVIQIGQFAALVAAGFVGGLIPSLLIFPGAVLAPFWTSEVLGNVIGASLGSGLAIAGAVLVQNRQERLKNLRSHRAMISFFEDWAEQLAKIDVPVTELEHGMSLAHDHELFLHRTLDLLHEAKSEMDRLAPLIPIDEVVLLRASMSVERALAQALRHRQSRGERAWHYELALQLHADLQGRLKRAAAQWRRSSSRFGS